MWLSATDTHSLMEDGADMAQTRGGDSSMVFQFSRHKLVRLLAGCYALLPSVTGGRKRQKSHGFMPLHT